MKTKLSVHEKQYIFCPTCRTKLKRRLIEKRYLSSCTACNFVFWNNPKPAVSVLLHKGKKILLIQRTRKPLKNYWCLPGGYINYEESLREAICRETKEETEQKLTIQGLIGVYRVDNDPRGVSIDIIYFGKGKGTISLDNEDKKWKYFSVNNLPKQIAYKHREAINDWFGRKSS